MTDDESKLLLNLLMLERADAVQGAAQPLRGDALIEAGEGLAPGFNAANIIARRWGVMRPDMDFSPVVALLCGAVSDSPGVAVMWAWSVVDWQNRTGEVMTVGKWCDAAPWGVPTESYLDRAWDAQKREGVNTVDLAESYAAG